jgi:hypothetical protein
MPVLVALTIPMLIAASDPMGDVAPCPGQRGTGDAPDLVAASGRIVELGTAAEWVLVFDRQLRVPDGVGRPFRVDVTIADPDVRTVSFAYYRGLNRIVRFDAVAPLGLEILALPERGENVFFNVRVEGRTITMRVPGRMLTRGVDLTGPRLDALRWGAIVRDGASCDLLGDGAPRFRLAPEAAPSVATAPAGREPTTTGGFGSVFRWIAIAGAIGALAIALGAFTLGRRLRGDGVRSR